MMLFTTFSYTSLQAFNIINTYDVGGSRCESLSKSRQINLQSRCYCGMSQVYDDFYDKMVDLGRIHAKKRGRNHLKMNASVPTLDHSRYFLVRKKTRKISEVDLGILLADFDNIMYRLLLLISNSLNCLPNTHRQKAAGYLAYTTILNRVQYTQSPGFIFVQVFQAIVLPFEHLLFITHLNK